MACAIELSDLETKATTLPAGTVAVAMSGGVDSSVVAALLHHHGQKIVGLTMQLWNQRRLPQLQTNGPAPHRCCSMDDVYDARRVAEHLGDPFLRDQFRARIRTHRDLARSSMTISKDALRFHASALQQ